MCLSGKFGGRLLNCAAAAAVLLSAVSAAGESAAAADAKIFDEMRFGATASIQGGGSHEDGVFPEVDLFFNPFSYDPAASWKDQLLHPRLMVGTSIGTAGSADQLYGGVTWDVTFSNKTFVEAGFGGVVHNGNLRDENDGPKLGCHLLFHEYVGAGYNFDAHWSLMAQVAHSSHADLCDGPNSGMTRAGLLVGYKF